MANSSAKTKLALNDKATYKHFKNNEKELLNKSGILLASVFYLIDQKVFLNQVNNVFQQIAYKLECEHDYLMTFLSKKEDYTKAETLLLLHKLCINSATQNMFLKEHNFQQFV